MSDLCSCEKLSAILCEPCVAEQLRQARKQARAELIKLMEAIPGSARWGWEEIDEVSALLDLADAEVKP